MDDPKVEGRRERKKRETLEALVAAAMALFSERGIYATRVEEITERADLGKGAFYNYFVSKDALVAELVARGIELLRTEHFEPRPERPLALEERVHRVASAHESFFERRPEYVLLFHQARGLLKMRNQAGSPLRDVFTRYLGVVAEALDGPELAGLGDEERVDLAAVVAGAVAGYRSLRATAGLPVRANTVPRILVRGVRGLVS